MFANYNAWLVLISVTIATLASYTALELSSHLSSLSRSLRSYWLFGGALALGVGIWSMHFVGMLAYHSTVVLTYDTLITLASFVIAIITSGIALFVVRHGATTTPRLALGAGVMGAGIAAMHYAGMAAIRMTPPIQYDPVLVGLSVLVAVTASVAALWLTSNQGAVSKILGAHAQKFGSSIIMGSAIAGMHYTGMAATNIDPNAVCISGSFGIESNVLAFVVTIGAIMVMLLTLVVTHFDARLTEHRKVQDELRLAANVFESIAEGVIVTDRRNRILAVNPAFFRITGFSREEVIGKTPWRLFSGMHDLDFYRSIRESIDIAGTWQGELWERRKSGEVFVSWTSINAVKDDLGQVSTYVSVFTDISERKQAEDRISHLAHHDALTGLPNRLLMEDRLNQIIQMAKRKDQQVAVLLLDLDHFKTINDALGHHIGDLMLRSVAERVVKSVRATDTVCRLGGDEFLVILSDKAEDKSAARMAEKLISNLTETYSIERHQLHVTPSIGICMYPQDGTDTASLLKNADAAMYHAKQNGRNSYQFFTPSLNAKVSERLALENSLHRALERGEFVLHYQPQFDLDSGLLIGIEALIRWQHPEWGMVSPAEFIPIAEESGLIISLGEWILRTACTEARRWHETGGSKVPVAINISSVQFQQKNFLEIISRVLKESGLSPEYLELELTEGIVMQHSEKNLELLQKLKQLGVLLAIDDFGTGYSSMSYLKRFPIDKLKIDQSFVRDVVSDPADSEIIKAIIALGHGLGLRIVAEGVETSEQLDMLRLFHCDEVQGYYFSKPLPFPELDRMLRQRMASNAF